MKSTLPIDLFVRVVQLGSISAAAREVDLMPSSVSRQISSLEQELDAKLFQRTTRKQSLTEAGAVFYDYALRLSRDMEEAREVIGQLGNSPKGTLYIAMESDFSQEFVAPLLPEFCELHPEINLRIVLSSNITDIVESGMDMAIRIGHLDDSSLISKKLTTSQSILCASPLYLSKNRAPQNPEGLTSHRCLSFQVRQGRIAWMFKKDLEIYKVSIESPIKANSLSFLKKLALASQGVVMLPKWMVQTELKNKELVIVLDDYQLIPSSTPVQAVFPSKARLAPKVRTFVDFLSERLES